MTIENQRNKKNTHLGEALGKHLPPLTLEEFTKFLKENEESKFKDETSRYFIDKYPKIKNDQHVNPTCFLSDLKCSLWKVGKKKITRNFFMKN